LNKTLFFQPKIFLKMKKLLLPFLLLLLTISSMKAQINETFETGGATPLPWTAGNGTYLGVVNNPAPNSLNSSAKCGGYVKSNMFEYSLFIATLPTALNLKTNNKFTVQIQANRDKVGKFIFKLEGSTGFKEVIKNIVITKSWQEYSFDFSALAANDSIKKVIFFFDPGVKDSKDTFYFDNIKQLPADACAGTVAPTTLNLLDDFECQRNASYSNGLDSLTVIDNPSKTGINTSAKVGRYKDAAGAGTDYNNLLHDNIDPIDLAKYSLLKVKVWASRAGLLLLKLEGGTSAIEVGTNITAAQVGTWIEATADFSSAKFAGNTRLVMFFNAGVAGTAGDVYYVDDIRFTETPPLENFEPQALTWGPFSNNAALHGALAVVDNPNATGAVNKTAKVGKYTKGTAAISTLTGTLPTGFKVDATAPQLNFQVYAPDAGKVIKVQLVSAAQGNKEASATVTAANTWEDLQFDFSNAAGITDISQINIIFDGGTAANGKAYHFDNLNFGKLTINACGTVTPNLNILDDYECQRNGNFPAGQPIKAINNPFKGQTNGSDKVGEYTDPTDEYSALIVDYGANAINLSKYNQLSVKIYSTKIVPLLFKLEGGTSPAYENPIVNVSKVNDWVTYNIDFSNQKGKNHKKVVMFLNAGVAHTTTDIYYLDDIQWNSEPITGCAIDAETTFVAQYFANGDLSDKPVETVVNPKKAGINTSNKVIKFDRRPGGDVFAGAFTDLPAPMKWTNTKYVIRAKVLMDHIGNFAPKVEAGPLGTGTAYEIPKANTKVNEWEEITADFSGKITGTEKYLRLTFFIDLNEPVSTVSKVSYIDDIVIGDGAGCVVSGIFDPITVERLAVYPNPATGELFIRNIENMKRVEITNLLGQRVKTVVFGGVSDIQTISLDGMTNGIYVVSAYDEKGLIANSKFVKE
jgi:Secretion system C-terminal sorting domain